ncbi:MAG: VCBS repeat-containing protein, partial [Verrucomicrobiota bacterium]
MILDPGLVELRLNSLPPGLGPTIISITNLGASVHVPDLYGVVNGHRFLYWTIDGAVQVDVAGRSLSGWRFDIWSNVAWTAHFIPEEEDADADRIPDWFEQHHGQQLASDWGTDADGDGFGFGEEFLRDSHPGLFDADALGGISFSFYPVTPVLIDPNLVVLDVTSSPPGLGVERQVVTNLGANIALGDWYGPVNGYRFVYATLNGERLTDTVGSSLGSPTFELLSNSVLQSVYVDSEIDGDTDGLLDWLELHFFGDLQPQPSDDGDGDVYRLEEEIQRDYHPHLVDEPAAGGISFSFSSPVLIDFNFFPRVQDVLLDGLPSPFFSSDTGTTGLFSVAGYSHPALGDWDGDRDLDLFVAASGGVVRVYENEGAPVVMSLSERTSNFIDLASAWNGISRPALALGDWNGDGTDDLIIGGNTGVLSIVSSSGHFDAPQTSTVNDILSVGGTSAIPALADITAGPEIDLLILRPDGAVDLY